MRKQLHVLTTRELAATAMATFLVLSSTIVLAQQHTPLSDQEIKNRVEHEVSEMNMNAVNVQVDVQNRVVTVTGAVPSLWGKKELLDEITDIDDVESVVSNITIVAAENDQSIADEVARSIRHYVFYSIYDDVNVAVNGGVVTLRGHVTSPHHATGAR